MNWVCLNRSLVLERDAAVPITDRGFLFGDGVFTTCKVEDGKIVDWEAHCERLRSQCSLLHIHPPDLDVDLVKQLIKKNEAGNGIWRLKILITGGNSPSLSLPQRSYGILLITLKPFQVPEGPVKVCRYPYSMDFPLAKMKSLSYLHRLMVKQFALDQGADDAIVCSSEGWVMEGAFSNLFWKDQGVVVTPDFSLPLLPGTYLSSLKGCREEKLTYEQLRKKDDVYLCNALCVRPCVFV